MTEPDAYYWARVGAIVVSSAVIAALTVLLLFGHDALRRRARRTAVLFLVIGIPAVYVIAGSVFWFVDEALAFQLTGNVTLCHQSSMLSFFGLIAGASVATTAYRRRHERAGAIATGVLFAAGLAALAGAVVVAVMQAPIDPRNAFAAARARHGVWQVFAFSALPLFAAGAALLVSRMRYASAPE